MENYNVPSLEQIQKWYHDPILYKDHGSSIKILSQPYRYSSLPTSIADDGHFYSIQYKWFGELHREDGPAEVSYNRDTGEIYYMAYYQYDCWHRMDGPAYEKISNTSGEIYRRWLLYGKEYPHFTSWLEEIEKLKGEKEAYNLAMKYA